jgi:glycosyltransferase involved in cell wall biosynthesis
MTNIVNIVGWDNGGGLSRDIDILADTLLSLGWDVAFNGRRRRHRSRAILSRAAHRILRDSRRVLAVARLSRPPFAVNLHVETIGPELLPLAATNLLIPHQEWFRDSNRPVLKYMNAVLVKTRCAERIFRDLGCSVSFMGWTSHDRSETDTQRSRRRTALHIAGSSLWKGTEAVLDAWTAHPDWPLLTVVRGTLNYHGDPIAWRAREIPPNVRILAGKVDDAALRRLQNENAIHVCPSEAEGYGHILVEAMSVGALIVTTDAPPMNELVTSERGLLVSAETSEPASLGRRFFISQTDLARKIEQAITMDPQIFDSLGRAARAWFEANARDFPTRLMRCLKTSVRQASY